MNLLNEFIQIVDCLNAHGIDYALCGGLAVAFHGYPRFTGDIDVLLLRDDLPRVKEALKTIDYTLAAGPFPFDSGTAKAREVHRISKIQEGAVFTLDLLIVNDVLRDAWKGREKYVLDGREIRIVSRSGLLEMKALAGRDQDRLDIKKLEETARDRENR
jgi:hypothetical protein